MDILPMLIGLSLCLSVVALAAYIWGTRKGQFDDPEGIKFRMLYDDDEEERYQERLKQQKKSSTSP